MNKVIISGRFTKDHELKYTQSGTAILSNTIASTRKFKNPDGEYDSDFVNVVLFNQQAKFVADYSTKGDMALIEGRIQTRNYDDKDGKKVYVTEIIADSVELIGGRKDNKPKEQVKETESNKLTNDAFTAFGQKVDLDENDLPF